ncbi:hypothetical protein Ancab_021563 [Ancistrocladus abbreviatus]
MLKTRRRPRYGPHLCAIATALLLLLSVSLLHSRLTSDRPKRRNSTLNDAAFDDPFTDDPLLRDSYSDPRTKSSDDRIDELDVVDDESSKVSEEEEILRGVESEEEENEQSRLSSSSISGYYYDHVFGAIRRAFDKRSIDEIDGWDDYSAAFDVGLASEEDRSKVAFGSDDVPVDENVRRKVMEIKGIEDALLLKLGSHVSPLREGWGTWFDAKSDFLRKDRMFKSNLEILNPLNNPLLQDPDGVGVTGLSRGDKLLQKGLLNEYKKVPFLGKKPLAFSGSQSRETTISDLTKRHSGADHISFQRETVHVEKVALRNDAKGKVEIRRVERRTLDEGASGDSHLRNLGKDYHDSGREGIDKQSGVSGEVLESSVSEMAQGLPLKDVSNGQSKGEFAGSIYADGRRWGYFPGLHPYLSFSNFIDAFFRKGKCSMRVFMVWNSPPWMYGVRHRRGLESLLFHHPGACVLLFSETIELDFFKEFVQDGFKIAVAMPNLDELLLDTPTSIFASVWHEWRATKFYPTHYSELVRLAALYNNSVGLEDMPAISPLNGAVMAFRKHSLFIKECLSEFYSTYDDTLLRWNGADLLTRASGNFSSSRKRHNEQLELKLQSSFIFFPINAHDITRYFTAPATENERAHEDALLRKILNESYTFHFWNSLTSALVPEPESLVARLLNHNCIRCSDVL